MINIWFFLKDSKFYLEFWKNPYIFIHKLSSWRSLSVGFFPHKLLWMIHLMQDAVLKINVSDANAWGIWYKIKSLWNWI